MRIAMIGPFGLQPKGTLSVRALPLARALVQRGHAVRLIVPPWDHPQDAGRRMQDAGVEIENIELLSPIPGLFHIAVTRSLVKRALDFKPDVIHCFKPKAYAGLAAWALWQMKRLGRVKARLIIDTDDWEGAGGWNDLSSQYSWVQKKMFAWQERWGLTHNDGVTVASRALESIVWSLGVKRERVIYVPNGMRNAQFTMHNAQFTVHSDPLNVPRGEFCILLYTRFFEFKVERVVEVLRRVIEQVPEAKLLVVGKGFFGEEERLLKQAESIGLRGAIEYAGWVPSDQLPGLFARSSVAIFPFDDTLINRTKCSVKLIDLLAAGVPVVADAVGQNSEYIRHNETGMLTPTDDVDAMAEAAIDLWRDAARREQLGANAARDV
ncbi:MAG TPA: glycosyltransferase family 4 protein, partial [Anaerolineae bacterium]|nr:glycosyltransferase family 4 protein [Anaerolineae bacterium]